MRICVSQLPRESHKEHMRRLRICRQALNDVVSASAGFMPLQACRGRREVLEVSNREILCLRLTKKIFMRRRQRRLHVFRRNYE